MNRTEGKNDYVILVSGHRNPDIDSLASAVALAELRRRQTKRALPGGALRSGEAPVLAFRPDAAGELQRRVSAGAGPDVRGPGYSGRQHAVRRGRQAARIRLAAAAGDRR